MANEIQCIIGLEIHAQMKTNSKIFCGCPNSSKDSEPNTNICPICLGYPGSKPALNKKVFENGIKIAKALNCEIPKNIFFSRKSYFYPDMTNNYQITQYEIPVGINGYLKIILNGEEKKIKIRRAHIEEDPGKLVHVGGDITNSDYTLVDYNRAGTPLIEIVTDPDFNNPKEAMVFLTKLRAMLEHLGIYDPEMIMKADANISIKGGARVEIKNITGFHNIIKALEYEYSRQRIMAKQGLFITQQETRAYSEKSKTTKQLRIKESEADYGYIFEPNLSWQTMEDSRAKRIFSQMNELPDERIKRFIKEYKLQKESSQAIIYADKNLADFFEECAKSFKDYSMLYNWIMTYLLKSLNYSSISIKDCRISPTNFCEFMDSMKSGKITERLGKELIKEMASKGKTINELLKEKKIKEFPKNELEKIIDELIEKNDKSINDYLSGNNNALNYLIGQALKSTKYQSKVEDIRKLLEKKISGKKKE